MSYPIAAIEGIGVRNASKLTKAGLTSTAKLLAACKTPKGRREAAKNTGIDEKRILKWTNMADLMRIRGIATQYSELLEAAGVDTVKELRKRRADNLAAKMAEVNKKKKLTRRTPPESVVANWVTQAKSLKPGVTY